MTAEWKSHVITVLLGGMIFYSARDVGVREWGGEALAYESDYGCVLTCIAFPFIVFLNVKLMVNMMSYTIYDKIASIVYHPYYMVFLLFLTWPLFVLQCYVCMEIHLNLKLKTLPSEICLYFCGDRLLLWSMVEVLPKYTHKSACDVLSYL